MAIRLVLAEDSYLAREGLRRLLETRPGVEVVADCGDLLALFDAVAAPTASRGTTPRRAAVRPR